MIQGVSKAIKRHKFITGIVVIVILLGGYYGYSKFFKKSGSNQIRYVLAQVERGTILTSVSGSGQISALDQVDVKPKVSGDVVYVGVKEGQTVNAGALLVQLDDTDAQQAVQTAETNLATEKLNLQKLEGMITDQGVLRGEKEKATADLNKTYEDGFNDVTNTFLNLPNIMTGLHDITYSSNFNPGQWNVDYYADAVKSYDEKALQYRDDANKKYQTARTAYNQSLEDYKAASRSSDQSTIESLINETYNTTKDIADAIKSLNNLIQFYQDEMTQAGQKPQTLSSTHLSSLNTYTGQTNTYLVNLLSDQTTIQSDKETLIQSTFDIQDQENKVAAVQQTLDNAQTTLAEYKIYSPFAGVIAAVNVQKGDSASGGTALVTLITRQQIAEVSLNEVDAANVKIGQKATLTFDALPDLTLTGKVLDIDTVGTVSQGVVSYTVKISLDTQNDQVKPGMTVSADIITDVKQNVLEVPNSAVKQQNGTSYVELPNTLDSNLATSTNSSGVILKNPTEQKQIQTGISNDEYTEVTSGLSQGDVIITRTIQNSSTQTSSSNNGTSRTSNAVFRIPGGGF